MFKSFVGYENLRSNSPLRYKQTLKISFKSTGYFSHNKLLKKAIFPIRETRISEKQEFKFMLLLHEIPKLQGNFIFNV